MVWELFSTELQKVIKERGFDRPTPVQEEGIPPIISGKNTLLIAPTGLGKTESVLLPIFDEFIRSRDRVKPISILYITPLKSLNRDLLSRILWWSERLHFDVSVRHGDTSQYERSMQLANPSEMFITTPETLQAMLVAPKFREYLRNIRWVVVDEIHELVGNKRGVQLSVGLERLKSLSGNDVQLVGLSATIGSPDEVANFLSPGKHCEIVNTVHVRKKEIVVESPSHTSKDDTESEKINIGGDVFSRLKRIRELIKENDSVLAFTNTREFAEVLSSRLKALGGVAIDTHHSSLSKDLRIDAEKRFKEQSIKALVCTSSLELGIDIGSISLVLQYMSPRQVSKLLQRVGRSGHTMSKTSKGILIATDPDDCFEASVIAKEAVDGRIEPTEVYKNALDVLGHQIVGIALEEYNVPMEKAYGIVKGAYPFKDLSMEEFSEVCNLMQKLRVLWVDTKYSQEPVLRRRSSSWQYYYFNLSTIPDVKNYRIIDVIQNKAVGSLDAEFVALHGQPGTSFIVSGRAWRIVDVQEGKILAEPEENLSAAIPAWEGELIPVPYEVAQGVAVLRKRVAGMLEKGMKKTEIIKIIRGEYPVSGEVAEKMIGYIKKQAGSGFVPDDKSIFMETWEDYVIIHAPFGSLANDTLGRVIASMLMRKLGSVGLQTDPYRIMIRLSGYQYGQVADAIRALKPEDIEAILRVNLPDSELFSWRFIQVCQRLGIIARNADFGKAYVRKLVDIYRNTPPYKEALNEIFQDKLDVTRAGEIIKRIKKGDLKLVVKEGLSPIGQAGLSRKYELVSPKKPDMQILEAFRERLLEKKLGLICMNCSEIFFSSSLRHVPERMQCRKCNARLIGYAPHMYVNDAQRLVKKSIVGGFFTDEDRKHLKFMNDTASMILAHGKDALLCLAGRGVGPRTTARILKKGVKGDDLLKAILEAEKQFAKTSRFWR